MTRAAEALSGGAVHATAPVEDESGIIWGALRQGEIWITRGEGGEPFAFAAGLRAEVKGDAGRLRAIPDAHRLVLGSLAAHPCLAWADVLAPVPNGMIEDTEALGHLLDKEVIRMYRPKNAASRFDIRFVGEKDRRLAAAVGTVCEVEDLTSTGLTPHTEAKILRKLNPLLVVHALSILHRAPVLPAYQQGEQAVVYHTLCAPAEPIPLEYDAFVARYGIEPVLVGADEG